MRINGPSMRSASQRYFEASGRFAFEGGDDQWIDTGRTQRRLRGAAVGRRPEEPLADDRVRQHAKLRPGFDAADESTQILQRETIVRGKTSSSVSEGPRDRLSAVSASPRIIAASVSVGTTRFR